MKINYKGNFEQVKLAVEDANEILYSSNIYDLIKQFEEFNCAKKTPAEIAEILRDTDLEVEVGIYKPRWVYSKVMGYFVRNRPNNIFLNSRKLYRDTNSITNTIVHEYVHAVDNRNNNDLIEFGHNCGTYTNTAPYVIGNIAEIIINGNEIENIKKSIDKLSNKELIHCLNDRGNSLIEEELIIEEIRIY